MAAGTRARTAQHSQGEAGCLENIPPLRHPSHHALAAAGEPALADTPPVISALHLKPHPSQRATLHHAASINRHLSIALDPFVAASKTV
jgi:hypothetical protein